MDTIDPETDDNIVITALQYRTDDVFIYTSEGNEFSLKETITDDADLESLMDLIIDGAELYDEEDED